MSKNKEYAAQLKEMEGFTRKAIAFKLCDKVPENVESYGDEFSFYCGIIGEVWERFGSFSNSAIKSAVYRTEPMQFILAQENKGRDMRNKAVLYDEKTAVDLAQESD